MRRFSGSSFNMLVGASMFWRGKFWRRRRIYSDEGFSVSTAARDAIVYREGNRKMTISVLEGNGVYEETIGRWDDNPTQRIANEERTRIAANIRCAFESQGLSVYFVERQQSQRS
jgi:hypothetical protein